MSRTADLSLAPFYRSRPVSGRRLLLIYNPIAGQRRRGLLTGTHDRLVELGCAVTLAETTRRGHAEELAAAADPAAFDAVIAAGGDGTINEVVNGLCRRALAGQGAPIPLGIVPLGTANVLALELGLPTRPAELAGWLAGVPATPVHLGHCIPDAGTPRLFTQMLGAGLDARVVASVQPHIKRRIGKGAYVLESLAQIAAGAALAYQVELTRPDGGTERHRVASIVLAKGHYYGGHYTLAPQARLVEPVFHACLFLRGGRLPALGYMAGMVLGGLARQRDYRIIPATRVRVEPLSGKRVGEPVQADGDCLGSVPFTAEIAPFTLPVLG